MLRFRVVGRYGEMAGHGDHCCIIDAADLGVPASKCVGGVDVLSGARRHSSSNHIERQF